MSTPSSTSPDWPCWCGPSRNNDGEEVEDQLFRFGRVLDSEPRLTALLCDYTAPADRRIALLDKVLDSGSGVNSTAAGLLTQTVELLRGERADEAVLDLAELAVARRGEVVAHVTAAAELSDAQRTRLTEVLSRIYGHPVSVQLHVDPEILGGLLDHRRRRGHRRLHLVPADRGPDRLPD